VVVNRFEIAI
jgi:hypothetical protein